MAGPALHTAEERNAAAAASYPVTVLGLLIIVGVVFQDLTFDYGGLAAADRVAYYRGVRSAGFPTNLFVPLAILMSFGPLILRLISGPRPMMDVLSMLSGIISIGIFVGLLIPMQASIASISHLDAANAQKVLAILDQVGTLHVLVLVLLIGLIVMQTVRHRVEIGVIRPAPEDEGEDDGTVKKTR